jgi:FixJ family two-component response regulator
MPQAEVGAALAQLIKQFGEQTIVDVVSSRVDQRKRNQKRNTERREKLAKYEQLVREGKIPK